MFDDDSSVGGPFEVTDGDYDYLPQSMFVRRVIPYGINNRPGVGRKLQTLLD